MSLPDSPLFLVQCKTKSRVDSARRRGAADGDACLNHCGEGVGVMVYARDQTNLFLRLVGFIQPRRLPHRRRPHSYHLRRLCTGLLRCSRPQ